MAEISDDSPDPPPPSSSSLLFTTGTATGAPGDGEESKRRTTRPGTKRLFLTLSVFLSFLSGLPFFLKSTEIYRSPLPFDSIDSLSRRLQSDPPSLPCRFHAVFLRSDPGRSLADRLHSSIYDELRRRTAKDLICGGCSKNFSVSVTVDSGTHCVANGAAETCIWRCGLLDSSSLGGDDEMIDGLLDSALEYSRRECSETGSGRVYTVIVVERENGVGEQEVRVVLGKHRHAWIVGMISDTDAVSVIGKIFVKFFMNGGNRRGEMVKSRGDFMPVGADGSLVLSFSLLNAELSDWIYDWEFHKMDKIISTSVVEALAPVANISVESQVLYHTPKSSNSYWDEKLSSYVFGIGDLPFFVNSNEWHLDTSITAAGCSKVLQFVVYVPSARECPLLLQLPDGEISKTNSFISPMWGGVVVWNPPKCSGPSEMTHLARSTISTQELEKIFQVFIAQLRMLFGLKANYLDSAETTISKFLGSEMGFTEWELDILYRHHACFNLLSCVTTLESLSKLVQSLPRMIVMDEIGKQVQFSLEAAKLAQVNASLGIYDASAVSSRHARALAEDAFFHPSIMSISYSSMEHYFAIYMPFFAPVSLHVLLAAIKELKRYMREKAKYKSFVAEQAKASG